MRIGQYYLIEWAKQSGIAALMLLVSGWLPKRLKPWWFQSEQGKVCLSVKYGSWTIELAKGKPSVEVASGEELVKALTSIKLAVEAGELDAQIETASASLRSGFKR